MDIIVKEGVDKMKVIDEMTEYVLVFKDNTEMYKNYEGEFISENRNETDELFEQFQEQVEQYYAKTWVKYETLDDEESDWYETDVDVIYDYRNNE